VPAPSSSAPSLGVVVLAYGAGRVHEPLLDSLLAEGVDPGTVVLVHNQAVAGEAPPPAPAGMKVLQTERNLGYAGGMNRGIAMQLGRGAENLLLLTHDARLRQGALGALVGALEADPGVGICGPVLLFTGTEEAFSYGGETTAGGGNVHRHVRPAGDGAGIAACDWIDGGTMLVRRAVLERVGAFDERFWGYCEDADLCARALRAGFGVGVVLAATADQAPGATRRRGAWAYLMTRNGLAYARRARGPRGLLRTAAGFAGVAAVNLLRAAARATRLHPGDVDEAWAIAIGTIRGAVDYRRGRWGPPPPGLPGMGDLGNA
jgi:N-acetylglucosaminyl-diphospho-decaprenol L-rhamnosyltransferase